MHISRLWIGSLVLFLIAAGGLQAASITATSAAWVSFDGTVYNHGASSLMLGFDGLVEYRGFYEFRFPRRSTANSSAPR